MAATPQISIGYTQTLTQNTVYALPSGTVFLQSSAALETSLDNSNWATLANSTTGVQTSATFARCTSGAAIVSVKRY